MAVLSFRMDFPGQNGVAPRIGRLHSSDALATIAGAGYLNPVMRAQSIAVTNNDMVAARGSDGTQMYKCSVAASGAVTLQNLG